MLPPAHPPSSQAAVGPLAGTEVPTLGVRETEPLHSIELYDHLSTNSGTSYSKGWEAISLRVPVRSVGSVQKLQWYGQVV